MKKQIYLSALIFTCCVFGINAQPIENTFWKAYFPTGTFFAYYHIGIDTLSISFDNITYTNTATYQQDGNVITTIDLYDGDCLTIDTGRYTYGIQNDTLKFTLISDPCIQRSIAMTTFHFVRLLTGIKSPLVVSDLKIYPNPATTTITIETPTTPEKNTLMTIYNINGQVLLSHQITEQQTVVDVSGLVQGVYFVRVQDERRVEVTKMIIN